MTEKKYKKSEKNVEKQEKKKVGRKKKLPTDPDELREYKRIHYYKNVKRYVQKVAQQNKIDKLKVIYDLIKESDKFDDIAEDLVTRVRVKDV